MLEAGNAVKLLKEIKLGYNDKIMMGEVGIIYYVDNFRGFAAVQFQNHLMAYGVPISDLIQVTLEVKDDHCLRCTTCSG